MGLRLFVRSLFLASIILESRCAPIQVEVKPGSGGLYYAAVLIGTPPQRLWASLDTGSSWTWIPEGEAGFTPSKSSSASLGDNKSLSFADGQQVMGRILTDTLTIGGTEVAGAKVVLAQNASGEGLLGLAADTGKILVWLWRPQDPEEAKASLLTTLWDEHQEVPQTFRLEFGPSSPKLLIGVPSSDSTLSGPSAITFLGSILTRRLLPNWYVSMRAIGLSYGKESPSIKMSFDFNSELAFGAAALLDSGATAIRLGTGLWERILLGMPNGCRQGDSGEIGCPCQAELPTISISFETMATFRILGLDSGADVIVCIPPSAYVTPSKTKKDWCDLAIVNAGERHTTFGMEAVVLGLPFFRSAQVVFDAGNRVVGVEPVRGAEPNLEAVCADPKNWWSTGKRFSPKRVVVALMIVSMVSSYVFVGFSQSRTAERLRALFEGVLGPGTFSPGSQRLQEERPSTQFVQMSNRNTAE